MFNPFLSLRLIKISFHKRYVYFFVFINILISLIQFLKFIDNPLDKTFYDWIIFNFNDFFLLSYILGNLFTVVIYYYIASSAFSNYVLIRFKHRLQWYCQTLFTILIMAFLYVVSLLCVYILQAITTLKFDAGWSAYSVQVYGEDVLNKLSPLTLIVHNITLVFLYLFTLGLIIFISSLYFRNPIISLVIALGYNTIGIVIYLSRLSVLYKFTAFYNALPLNSIFKTNGLSSYLYFSYSYWIVLIIIVVLIGKLTVNRIDFDWRNR